MGNSNFTVSGTAALSRALEDIKLDLRTKIDEAQGEEADAILKDSKDNYVPRDNDTLADSGVVTESKIVTLSGPIEHTISFGGDGSGAERYAVAVHEYPSEHNPASWNAAKDGVHFRRGGPKYLEIPFRKAESGMLERIASKVKLG
jgi:hypothetical protein